MNADTNQQKEDLEKKISRLPESMSNYIEYVQKGLAEVIDFNLFKDIGNDRVKLDLLYLIGLGSDLGVIRKGNGENDEDKIILDNIEQGFIKEGYKPEDAKNGAKIIVKYVKDLNIVNQLLNEKSVLLLGHKGYTRNMNAIYDKFFDSKDNLLEKGINYIPKGKEGCYLVVYQYNKEISDELSNISHEIGRFIKNKKEQGLVDNDVDFIEYSSDDIHTGLIATKTVQNFSADDSKVDCVNDSFKNLSILPFNLNLKGIKINSNSLIVEAIPSNATFLENIKKSLSAVPSELGFSGSWGSHITIGRFIGNISNHDVLDELYGMIDGYSNELPSQISAEKYIIGYLNVYSKYGNESSFKIFPKYSKKIQNVG